MLPGSVKPASRTWLTHQLAAQGDRAAHRPGTPEPSGHLQGCLCAVPLHFSRFVEVIITVLFHRDLGGELSALRTGSCPPLHTPPARLCGVWGSGVSGCAPVTGSRGKGRFNPTSPPQPYLSRRITGCKSTKHGNQIELGHFGYCFSSSSPRWFLQRVAVSLCTHFGSIPSRLDFSPPSLVLSLLCRCEPSRTSPLGAGGPGRCRAGVI